MPILTGLCMFYGKEFVDLTLTVEDISRLAKVTRYLSKILILI